MSDIWRKRDKTKLRPERIAKKRNLELLSLEKAICRRKLYPQLMTINRQVIFAE